MTALVWDDAKSFRRHLEEMRMFHRSHRRENRAGANLIKDMTTKYDWCLQGQSDRDQIFIKARGRLLIVPIWEISPPRNSQN